MEYAIFVKKTARGVRATLTGNSGKPVHHDMAYDYGHNFEWNCDAACIALAIRLGLRGHHFAGADMPKGGQRVYVSTDTALGTIP